jgi:hypothetical protein
MLHPIQVLVISMVMADATDDSRFSNLLARWGQWRQTAANVSAGGYPIDRRAE